MARLATVDPDGRPHLVPIVFAVLGDTIVSAVDGKPKRTTALRRLANVAARPAVAVLVDHYDEDWTALWWVRADGTARILDAAGVDGRAAIGALVRRYAQYDTQPPGGPVLVIDVHRWSRWSVSGRSGG